MTETENRPVVVYNWQWEKRWVANKPKGIFGSDRNVLKLDYGDGCTTYKFIKTKNWSAKKLFIWNSYWKLKLHSNKDRLQFCSSITINLMLIMPCFNDPE